MAGGRFAYTDTDSCLVDDIGAKALEHLVDPTKLGMLKYEGSFEEIMPFSAKFIIYDPFKETEKVTSKGLKGYKAGDLTNKVTIFPKAVKHILKNELDFIDVHEVEKRVSFDSDKRVYIGNHMTRAKQATLNEDGGTTYA